MRCLLAMLLAASLAAAQEPSPQQPPPPAPQPAEARPGFLGVGMAPEPIAGAEPAAAAVRVTGIVPGSAAEQAGLLEGDVILEVDGARVAFPPDEALSRFGALVRARGPGAEVRLLVRRRALSVRSYLDEEPTGPPIDAAGGEARDALPDLNGLLEQNPGKLVSVRARLEDRESRIVATLGERPNTSPEPLPQNVMLRPDLEALPLDPGAALAARVIARARKDGQPLATTLEQVRARLDDDERVRDPFRLATVRYLKRDPLRLPGASRALAGELAGITSSLGTAGGGVAGFARAARPVLDAIAAVDTASPPSPPEPGISPRQGGDAAVRAHVAYARACLDLAAARVELALARLDEGQRAALQEQLPALADTFAERLYLHEDPDRKRWRRNQGTVALLALVDRAALVAALEALAPLADPAWHATLRAELVAAESQGITYGQPEGTLGRILYFESTPQGDIIVGGSGPNVYRCAPRLAIDLDGDDRWHGAVAGASGGRRAAALIDLGGDDRYHSTEPFAQGAACLGAALLVDTAGDDRYASSASFAQGAALCGAAALVDLAGHDEYSGSTYVQGSGLGQALALLLDLAGDDARRAGLYAQAFAGPGAFAALVDGGGDDRYVALAQEPCTYGDPGVYHAMSQGSAAGFRQVASGGVAALVDRGGRDQYEAGNFSLGGGYYFAWGLVADLGDDDDRYEASRYGLGFAAHSALGSFIEEGGDDRYRALVGAQEAAAWDLSAACHLDDGGDDDRVHAGPLFGPGASAHNGVSIFVDRAGRDRYGSPPGRAGPNDYHGGPSLSVFIDGGGQRDEYIASGLSDGVAIVDGEVSARLDLPCPLDEVDEATLQRLIGP